jgi:hypothetical protein
MPWLRLLSLLASVPKTRRCSCPSLTRALACEALCTRNWRRPEMYFPAIPESADSAGGEGFSDRALRVRSKDLPLLERGMPPVEVSCTLSNRS